VKTDLRRGSEGKVLLSAILTELRRLGYEVQIQVGDDAFTYPVDSQLSTWIIVIPRGQEETALAHELGHIWLAAHGYHIFGLNPARKLREYLNEEDLEAIAYLFNSIADVAVELVMKEWGYNTSGQYMLIGLTSERDASAVMFLRMIGLMDEEEFVTFFHEDSWQYRLTKKINEIFVSDKSLNEKLDAIVDVLNEFLPFKINKDLELVLDK